MSSGCSQNEFEPKQQLKDKWIMSPNSLKEEGIEVEELNIR